MTTQNKNIEGSVFILKEEDKKLLIQEYSFKYSTFIEISDVLIESMLQDIVVPKDSTILKIKSILEKEILTYLCDLVRRFNREDISSKLQLLFDSELDDILIKLGCSSNKDEVKKTTFLEAVKDYRGQEEFLTMFVSYAARNMNCNNKEMINEVIDNVTICHPNIKVDDIALLGNSLNILYEINLFDIDFVRFVILKFGFNGYYLDDDSIKRLLSLSDSQFETFMSEALAAMNMVSQKKQLESKKVKKKIFG